ncbi:MAG: serine/threonine protein kinase, partial [Gemmataceae bacterium]
MAKDSTDDYLAGLRTCGLLAAEQAAELAAWCHQNQPDPNALAKEVHRRGWMTHFQLKEIYRGRSAELFVGPYILVDLLGEGGMGRVFKAHQTRMGRDVALKVIRKEKLSNPMTIRRFRQEIQAVAQLAHPNVILAFDADETAGMHYFAMEYIEGSDLTQLVRTRGPLPISEACEYIRQGALGLQHAHERGMVHRDVKPSNLFVSKTGQVKLLDLGLALLNETSNDEIGRLTQDGYVIGTPDFLSPEQARNPQTVDIRADIYALGCTLYYILTGRVPYDSAQPAEKLIRHCTEPPPVLRDHL